MRLTVLVSALCVLASSCALPSSPVVAAPGYSGLVGVGTWKTQAEFKDIQVTKDGKTLFQSDFTKPLQGWKTPRGKWEVADGVLRQTSDENNTAALVGDPNWGDYTLSVKARKISGTEGFFVYFQTPDENNYSRWNLGGWNDTKHAFDIVGLDPVQMDGTIEMARWYDVRLEIEGPTVKGYLDGALVQQITRSVPPVAGRSWGTWTTWGDQGDGTYANPVLPADYSDLDCIRVGSDYYAISSSFQFSPGMVILQSKDLVNWRIAGHAVPDITQVGPEMNWDRMNRYGVGIWAGGIRYHDNKFWIFFGAPDEGYFMTSAKTVEGPWSPLHQVQAEGGWDDCCPFWDDDGQGYFIGTKFKDGYKTYIFKLTPDGRDIIKDSAVLVNEGHGREANKLFKKDGWYYHFYSEVKGGARVVMMQRSKNILGPYTEKKQLTDGNQDAKEPNQGGIVDTVNGDWYFFTHHGHGDWEGRAASTLPVKWVDGWPLIGDVGDNGLGQMVWTAKKPIANTKTSVPQTDDEFKGPNLGLQWEWNYQPRADKWSLTERPGFLRLKAWQPLADNNFFKAGNTLTQRSFRTTGNEAIAKLDLSGMADGQKAGLCHFVSGNFSVLGVAQNGTTRTLEYRNNGTVMAGPVLTGNDLWVRSVWGLDGKSQYSYSTDGKTFTDFGDPYQLRWGGYRGDRVGIYSYNNKGEAGYLDVDSFHYSFDGPQNRKGVVASKK